MPEELLKLVNSNDKKYGRNGFDWLGNSLVPLLVHKFTPELKRSSKKPIALLVSDRIVQNVDVAPTIAKLFGKKFPEADGKVIKEVIKKYV